MQQQHCRGGDRRLAVGQCAHLIERLKEHYATPQAKRAAEVYLLYRAACARQGLPPVSERTFYRVRARLTTPAVVATRSGRRAAYTDRPFFFYLDRLTPRHGERPFALAHLDHTELDILLVSSLTGKPFGRPWLTWLEQQHYTLRMRTVRPLYRAVHPSRNLETLKGVGQDSAAVYASFIGDPRRFSSTRLFRGWTGMVPVSNQSAESEAKGLHLTQAGPDLIKKYAYLDAEIARRYDPQIAALYYDQMMRKGKHHKQAVCACATHLLDRVLAVLRADKPYELRDVDGTALTGQQARERIVEHYTVPSEVRQRTNKRNRRAQNDQRAERRIGRSARAATADCARQ